MYYKGGDSLEKFDRSTHMNIELGEETNDALAVSAKKNHRSKRKEAAFVITEYFKKQLKEQSGN